LRGIVSPFATAFAIVLCIAPTVRDLVKLSQKAVLGPDGACASGQSPASALNSATDAASRARRISKLVRAA